MANEFIVRKGLIVNGSGSTLLDVQGSQGQLFSITDSLSGSLFAVSDISGIPVLEAFSDDTVKMGTFGSEALIASASVVGIGGDPDGTYGLKVTGDIGATGEVTAYVSDERLKDIIEPITEPVQKIQSLDGFYYIFNETAESIGIESGDKRHVGLSAQQVQKVLPEIVTFAPADRQDGKSKTGEDYLTIHYDKLVPLLVEGIKEQQQTIQKLQEEVKELQQVIRRN